MASDANSFANVDDVRTVHLSLDWVADFEACVLRGFATLRMELLRGGVEAVVLDSKALDIATVQLWADAYSDKTAQPGSGAVHAPAWSVSVEKHEAFGSALTVALPAWLRGAGSRFSLRIGYKTAAGDGCSAAQWLPAAQTAGKRHPYLFTQCQAIHARALLPCQDSPGSKFTYDATVTAPAALVALMSATAVQEPAAAAAVGDGASTRTWRFVQRVPIAAYLLALAVGELESREVGPRSRVWSEPAMVEAAAAEFGGTEAYIAEAEAVCGPYEWGRYDLLCLPPSFPYGGMENPQLTFVTPTLLAGDRSLAQVVAHEIAHSWMGNLVTNHTWGHFWMNEGFTVWTERKILASISGPALAQLHAFLGFTALQGDVARLQRAGKGAWTRLALDTAGVDPDDSFSRVPYEKGFHFIWFLERTLGPLHFCRFVREVHVAAHRFGTVAAPQWRATLEAWCAAQPAALDLPAKLATVDWDLWVKGEGMPPVEPPFDRSLVDEAEVEVARWMGGLDALAKGGEGAVEAQSALHAHAKSAPYAAWPVLQQMLLLDMLADRCELEAAPADGAADRPDSADSAESDGQHAAWHALLATLDGAFTPALSSSTARNAELRFRFGMLAAKSACASFYPAAVALLEEQGRMKVRVRCCYSVPLSTLPPVLMPPPPHARSPPVCAPALSCALRSWWHGGCRTRARNFPALTHRIPRYRAENDRCRPWPLM